MNNEKYYAFAGLFLLAVFSLTMFAANFGNAGLQVNTGNFVNTGEQAGTAAVYTSPVGANVYLDGQFMGTTTNARPVRIYTASSGNHKIEVRKAGYKPSSRIVFLNVGNKQGLNDVVSFVLDNY